MSKRLNLNIDYVKSLILMVLFFVLFNNTSLLSSWSRINSPTGGAVYQITNSRNTIFANAFGSGIYRSIDDGVSWEQVTAGNSKLRLTTNLIADNNNIYASALSGEIFKSSDNGNSWLEVYNSQKSLGSIEINNIKIEENTVYLCTNKGLINSTDNGNSWVEIKDTLPTKNYFDIIRIKDTIFLATDYGLFMSEDGGNFWNKYAFLTFNVYKLFRIDGRVFICVFDQNGSPSNQYSIFEKPAGSNDLLPYHPETFGNRQILGVDNWNDYFVISSVSKTNNKFNFYIHYSSYKDSFWSQIYFFIETPRIDITFGLKITENFIFAGTRFDGIRKMNHFGNNLEWVNESIYNVQISSLSFNAKDILAGTEENGIYISTNNGSIWSLLSNSPKDNESQYKKINKLYKYDDRIYSSSRNGLDYTTDNGQSWQHLGWFEYNMQDLIVDNGIIYAIGNLSTGYLFISMDNGKTWTRRNLPDNAVIYSFSIRDNIIIIGTSNGIYKSTDDGINWNLVEQSYSGLSAALSIVKTGDVFLASSHNGVIRSSDNGETWAESANGIKNKWIHSLYSYDRYVFCASDSGAYLSYNQGKNWEEINSGLRNYQIYRYESNLKDIYLIPFGDALYKSSINLFTKIQIGQLPTNVFCSDMDFSVEYTVNEGNNFNSDNSFILEISNENGTFDDNTTQIGNIQSNSSGTISAKIPSDLTEGNKYRMRVISTSPKSFSIDNLFDITVIKKIKPEITGVGKVCLGNEELYFSPLITGLNYNWEVENGTVIGNSTSNELSVKWDKLGTGSVKLITSNLGQCKDSTEISVQVNPNPPKPEITLQNDELVSSSSNGNQWYFEGNILQNDTNSILKPSLEGNYTVVVTNEFGCKSEISDIYKYENNPDFLIFTLDTLSAYSGDNLFVNIRLLKNKKYYSLKVNSLSAVLVCNANLLFPTGNDKGVVVNGKRFLRLELDTNYITQNIIASIPFMAMLGDAESTPLRLENVQVNGISETSTKVNEGKFNLLGICYEGGARLITSSFFGEITNISPNPAANSIEVEIFTSETGNIILELINSAGIVESELFNGKISSGTNKLSINLDKFSIGEYFIRLVTDNSTDGHKLLITR